MPTPILILSPLNFYHFTKYLLFLDAPVVEDLFRTLSAMDVIVGRKPMSIIAVCKLLHCHGRRFLGPLILKDVTNTDSDSDSTL